MVLTPGRADEAEEIFLRWGLDFAVIGQLTDTGRMIVRHQGDIKADMPLGPLADGAPAYERPHVATPPRTPVNVADIDPPDALGMNMGAALKTLMGGSELASRRWVWEQYDHMVMGDTVVRPGGDAAVVRVHGAGKGLAMSADVTPRYCFADPVEGGKQAVAETYRNISACGGLPLAITNCLNFGNPERPEIMGQFVGCLEGMGEAGRVLDYPVVSGNVSLYNETNGTGIYPTPAIGGVGLVPDIDHLAYPVLAENQIIYVLGKTAGHLGCSLYLRDIAGLEAANQGPPPPVDLAAEKKHGGFIRGLIQQGVLQHVHDCSDGGLLVALAEMAIAGECGFSVTTPSSLPEPLPPHAYWFGEDQGRYVVALGLEEAENFEAAAAEHDIACYKLGKTGGLELTLDDSVLISIKELREAHENWFPDFMQARSMTQ